MSRKIVAFSSLAALLALAAFLAPVAEAEVVPLAPAPFALVELFTSEGCSSCPPADENLARITAEADASGQRVFTLELHVDYWNALGWNDPFSDVAHSDRQSAYGRARGIRGVYTPQLLVNGKFEAVGSNASESRAAIGAALSQKSSVGVEVKATRESPTTVRINYRVSSDQPVDLNLVLAQDHATTSVKRGENAAKVLQHRHVARAFTTLHLERSSSGSWLGKWPADAQGAAFVVGYAAEPKSLAIVGAAAQRLP